MSKDTLWRDGGRRVSESWASRRMRWGFNLFPAFRGTGARITYIAGDFREARVELPLYWRTRNYVGTIFGGSLYGAVDPMYMILLIKVLGPGYTVWDKAATIRFLKPGRSRLYARFLARGGGDPDDPPADGDRAVGRPGLPRGAEGRRRRRPRLRRQDGLHTPEQGRRMIR